MCSTWLLAVFGAMSSASAPLPGDPPAWQTKGDANAEVDSLPVRASLVRGRVAWSIPGLGRVVTAVRGGPAVLLPVSVPLTLLVATELLERRRKAGSSRW